MNFPNDFYSYLKNNTLVEIKGGTERETFLKIWMVVVGNRVFARSWSKSPRSWFTAFTETGVGEIKYGDMVISVKGNKLEANDATHELINKAYLEKYTQPGNVEYALGITQPEYTHYTLELFYNEN